jgi:hypothetical protein
MDAQLVDRFGVFCALLAVVGCGAEAADQSSYAGTIEALTVHGGATALAEPGSEVLSGSGPWLGHTGSGTAVTLSSADAPFHAGRVTVSLEVDGAEARSLDLASPTMPMHGLVRVAVADGKAEVEIPMEGRWAMYVNLDDVGAESAEFVFDVAAGAAGDHVHRGGS